MKYLRRFWNWLLGKTTIDEAIEAKLKEVKERVNRVKEEIADVKEAASEVKSRRTTRLDAEDASGKIKESDVQRMTAQQYEANADSIMESIRSGKFVYDISGAAR